MGRRHRPAWNLLGATACAVLGACCALSACATAAPGARSPSRPCPPPTAGAAQHLVLEALGRRLHRAIGADNVGGLWFDDLGLRALLRADRASAAAVARHNQGSALTVPALPAALFTRTTFAGVCVQQARLEPAGGAVGLRQPGWVIERVLVVGAEPGGGRVAAWVEGAFVSTDAGTGAVWIDRVEAPRRDHADLQLAVCDLRVGAW